MESFWPTKRFAEGRAFSVSLMRVCFWRSNSSLICVRCFASASSRRPSALLADMFALDGQVGETSLCGWKVQSWKCVGP